MPEGEGRHYLKEEKKNLTQSRSLLISHTWCWFWPTRPSLDPESSTSELHRSPKAGLILCCLYLSPLYKESPYTAKPLGSFSKSFSPAAVTPQVKAKPLGLSCCTKVTGVIDFQQEEQPLLQTENGAVNNHVFHFAFDIISQC